HPLPLRHGDRFVLRSVGTQTTAAGGHVLDPLPARRAKGMLARLELAEHLDALDHAADHAARIASLLQLHHGHMPKTQARASLDVTDLAGSPGVVELESAYVLGQTLEA